MCNPPCPIRSHVNDHVLYLSHECHVCSPSPPHMIVQTVPPEITVPMHTSKVMYANCTAFNHGSLEGERGGGQERETRKVGTEKLENQRAREKGRVRTRLVSKRQRSVALLESKRKWAGKTNRGGKKDRVRERGKRERVDTDSLTTSISE